MEHRVRPSSPERCVQDTGFGHVGPDLLHPGMGHGSLLPVDADALETSLDEGGHEQTAEEAASACDENSHGLRAGSPAAVASRWNIFTVSSENSSRSLPTSRQLLQQVVRDGDDVAADRVGLDDVEDLARARPDQLELGLGRERLAAPRASAAPGRGRCRRSGRRTPR